MGSRHKRQLTFFLIAILLPAAVLVGLAVRVVRQDRELATREADDQQRTVLEQVRRELAARLQAIKFQEINRRIRAREGGVPEKSDSAIVLVTGLNGTRLVLPWKSAHVGRSHTPTFAQYQHDGEL